MRIEIDVAFERPGFTLEVAVASEARLLGLVGASGSGKTTLLDIVAGIVRPDRGRVAIGDEVLVDTARGIARPVHRRGVGYVFQDGRLFPHLTVRQNLLFGRWFAGKRSRTVTLEGVVDLLGIDALLARRAVGLSGGERQRVAIGRALLAAPAVLLMDEPLAALDEARRAEILPYIDRIKQASDVPILYVSHSRAEVDRLADAVVRLERGRAVASGPPPRPDNAPA